MLRQLNIPQIQISARQLRAHAEHSWHWQGTCAPLQAVTALRGQPAQSSPLMLKSQGAGILEPRTDSSTMKKTTQMTNCDSMEHVLQLLVKQKPPRVDPHMQHGECHSLAVVVRVMEIFGAII